MSVVEARHFPLSDVERFEARPVSLAEAEGIGVFDDCLRIWRDRRGGGLPRKSRVDPLAFAPSSLPWIMLVDVERHDDRFRFRYRLTGTGIDIVQNRNLTGSYVDQQTPEILRDALQTAMTELVIDREPQFIELKFTNATGYKRWLRALRLPLTGDQEGDAVDHILIALHLF